MIFLLPNICISFNSVIFFRLLQEGWTKPEQYNPDVLGTGCTVCVRSGETSSRTSVRQTRARQCRRALQLRGKRGMCLILS